jgi:hypothetical protein
MCISLDRWKCLISDWGPAQRRGVGESAHNRGYAGDRVKYFRDMPVIGRPHHPVEEAGAGRVRCVSVECERRPPSSNEGPVATSSEETSGAEDVADLSPRCLFVARVGD